MEITDMTYKHTGNRIEIKYPDKLHKDLWNMSFHELLSFCMSNEIEETQ